MNLVNKRLIGIIILISLPVSLVFGQKIIKDNAEPEKITSGYQFTEGPVWHSSGYLLFSDIPTSTVYKWMPGEEVVEYLKHSGESNGLTFDLDGQLLLAQHKGAVARLTKKRDLSIVVDSYKGKRLNSPNDLTVKSDGAIYFTDPPFGVSDEDKELDVNGVYRYSREEGIQLLVEDFDRPNGIVFSPDEERLYVNDTSHNHIRVFNVDENGLLIDGKVFAVMEADGDGAADGMKVDTDGNLYSTGPGGLWIFSPEGKLIQRVDTPRITNLAWGGAKGSTLFLTAPDAIYKLETSQKGKK